MKSWHYLQFLMTFTRLNMCENDGLIFNTLYWVGVIYLYTLQSTSYILINRFPFGYTEQKLFISSEIYS